MYICGLQSDLVFRLPCKLDSETKVHDPVHTDDQIESTTYMHASSVYGLTGVQLHVVVISVTCILSVYCSTKCQVR